MTLRFLFAALAGLALAGLATACARDSEPKPETARESGTLEISWSDLVPESERETLQAMRRGAAGREALEEFSASGRDYQAGSFRTVEALDGQLVRMPGFLLPLDLVERGSARAFLLLPYHGACVHYPAPPPNQIVYVTSHDPIHFDRLWDPVWIEGRLEIQRRSTELAETAYTMDVHEVTPYEH